MIVVDASVLANVVGDDGDDGRRTRAELQRADGVSAPDLVDVETVAVLRKRWLARTIDDRRFAAAIDDLADLAVDRYPTLPLMRRAYQLRANLTAYDAAYVALAEGLDCALLTADAAWPGPRGLAARSNCSTALDRPPEPMPRVERWILTVRAERPDWLADRHAHTTPATKAQTQQPRWPEPVASGLGLLPCRSNG